MCEIINIEDYRKKQELKRQKAALTKKMNTNMTKEEDYTVLQLLDIFYRKRYPDIFWEFDLFINGEKE